MSRESRLGALFWFYNGAMAYLLDHAVEEVR
jgi:hypothetical protein